MRKLHTLALILGCSIFPGAVCAAPIKNSASKIEPELLKKSALMIDRHVAGLYRSKDLEVPEVVDDPIFLRRSFLVAAGRIPNLEETRAFLETDQSDKREALVDYLMDSDGYRSHMTNWLFDMFRVQDEFLRLPGYPYVEYIYKSAEGNKPWNQLTSELVSATGSAWENGAVGYYLRDLGMELDNLSNTMRIFTGTRMECAQCHDDPFGEYERRDFYELAAFTSDQGPINHEVWEKAFAPLAKNGTDNTDFGRFLRFLDEWVHVSALASGGAGRIALPNDYQYRDGDPGEMVGGKTPFGKRIRTSDRSDSGDSREAFANWMVGEENERFTATIVNRMWKRVMGQGLWEPVDEYVEAEKTVIPALTKDLTRLMIDLDYDLKAFQHILFATKTFQFAANSEAFASGLPQSLNGRQLERMSAEQVWDSLLTLSEGNPDKLEKRTFDDGVYLFQNKVLEEEYPTMEEFSKMILSIKDPEEYYKTASELFGLITGKNGTAEVPASGKLRGGDTSLVYGEGLLSPVLDGPARASELQAPTPENHFLRTFGQSDRVLLESASSEANLSQVLAVMNGEVENMIVSNDSAAIYQAIDGDIEARDKVRYIYYAILGRPPLDEEMKFLMRDVIDGSKQAYRNLVSSLLSTHEFLFIQ